MKSESDIMALAQAAYSLLTVFTAVSETCCPHEKIVRGLLKQALIDCDTKAPSPHHAGGGLNHRKNIFMVATNFNRGNLIFPKLTHGNRDGTSGDTGAIEDLTFGIQGGGFSSNTNDFPG